MNAPRITRPPMTADQLSQVHPWDRPGFNLATLDAEDTLAYWRRKQAQIVTATSVSEQVFLTAQAAERIRNNRRLTRQRLGMPQPVPLPADGEAIAHHAGLPLLDTARDTGDDTEVAPLALILPEGVRPPEAEPQAASIDAVLAMEPEEGEETDHQLLMGLRRQGAAVKIKGKSPPPPVTRQPVFNPIDALRQRHALYNATRMRPLAHGIKVGLISLMTGQPPPSAFPQRAQVLP